MACTIQATNTLSHKSPPTLCDLRDLLGALQEFGLRSFSEDDVLDLRFCDREMIDKLRWELIQRCTAIQLDSPGFELGLLRNTTGMKEVCWENSRCLHWIIDFGRFNLLFPWSLPLFQEDMEVLLNQLADYIDLTFVKDGFGDGRYEKIYESFVQQLTLLVSSLSDMVQLINAEWPEDLVPTTA